VGGGVDHEGIELAAEDERAELVVGLILEATGPPEAGYVEHGRTPLKLSLSGHVVYYMLHDSGRVLREAPMRTPALLVAGASILLAQDRTPFDAAQERPFDGSALRPFTEGAVFMEKYETGHYPGG
jgi:hypothetical protein